MITNVLSPVGEMANLLVPVLSSLLSHTKVIRSRWLSWWRLWEGGYSGHFDDQHHCHPCKHPHPSGKTERDRLGATGASLSSLYPVLQSSFTLSSSSLYHLMLLVTQLDDPCYSYLDFGLDHLMRTKEIYFFVCLECPWSGGVVAPIKPNSDHRFLWGLPSSDKVQTKISK